MEYILNLAYTALVKQHFSKLIVNLLLKIRYLSSFMKRNQDLSRYIEVQRFNEAGSNLICSALDF